MPKLDPPFTRTPDDTKLLSRSPRTTSITPTLFREMFGESLDGVLNLSQWRSGFDLPREYERIEREVTEAIHIETELQSRIRDQVFPVLESLADKGVPKAGKYEILPKEIREIHEKLLFPGCVEAVDGSCHVHDTLPLTIYSLGVSLVSYRGNSGTWGIKLFRRDLRQKHEDPIAMVTDLLKRRSSRTALNHESNKDPLSLLARRALMTYAERSVLVQHATGPWRIGHGNPVAHELLTGGGCADLTIMGIKILCQLILHHRKFVFVTSEPADRLALTIGHALRPLEFAICGRLDEKLRDFVEQVHLGSEVTVDDTWDGTRLSPEKWLRRFTDDVASHVVYGVYRATPLAPAQLFYAHQDLAEEAARIAVADSMLQELRGFPLLIDLADQTCRTVYGGGGLHEMADAAYVKAGQPYRYFSERVTRDERPGI